MAANESIATGIDIEKARGAARLLAEQHEQITALLSLARTRADASNDPALATALEVADEVFDLGPLNKLEGSLGMHT